MYWLHGYCIRGIDVFFNSQMFFLVVFQSHLELLCVFLVGANANINLLLLYSVSVVTYITSYHSGSIGYVYLTFEMEKSIKNLLMACSQDPTHCGQYYLKVSTRRTRDKQAS